jgi:hypothetical protein
MAESAKGANIGNAENLSNSPPLISPIEENNPQRPVTPTEIIELPEIVSPITAVDANGREFTVPRALLQDMVVASRPPLPKTLSHIIVADSGFGGVQMVVEGAKHGIGIIAHIKNSTARFPKEELEKQMAPHPSGCWLVLKTVIDNITILAI